MTLRPESMKIRSLGSLAADVVTAIFTTDQWVAEN